MSRPSKKWTVRKRQWPNGRVYYVVGIGPAYGPTVAGKSGGESKFYDKSHAQAIADEMNGVPDDSADQVIEQEGTEMNMIDAIRKDAEAGTWYVRKYTSGTERFQVVCREHVGWVCNLASEDTARRIARVPDMEAALLAAEALEDAVTNEREMVCQDLGMQMEAAAAVDRALDAYRKATGEPQ